MGIFELHGKVEILWSHGGVGTSNSQKGVGPQSTYLFGHLKLLLQIFLGFLHFAFVFLQLKGKKTSFIVFEKSLKKSWHVIHTNVKETCCMSVWPVVCQCDLLYVSVTCCMSVWTVKVVCKCYLLYVSVTCCSCMSVLPVVVVCQCYLL